MPEMCELALRGSGLANGMGNGGRDGYDTNVTSETSRPGIQIYHIGHSLPGLGPWQVMHDSIDARPVRV